MLPVLTKY